MGEIMKLTPAMEQFMKIKNENPDCIILFRMGDFYETFFDDAKTVSKELNIVLTARGKDKVPLAGIPFHSIDPYIAKLVKRGFKVAMVEQLEDPKKAKGLVKRGLVRIITPGTVLDENVLDEKSNNFLVSISKDKNFGIAAIDLSTGEFISTEVSSVEDMWNEIKKINPSEILIPSIKDQSSWVKKLRIDYFVNTYNDVFYYNENAKENLKRHFGVMSLSGFGLDDREDSISSCGGIISYLKETQMSELENISKIRYYHVSDYMLLDSSTVRNLELFSNVRDNTSEGSLFSVIDKTKTSMGSRLLKSWMSRPLLDLEKIEQRLEAVEELSTDRNRLSEVQNILKDSLDIQRLVSRISNNTNCPKDLVGLKNSLMMIPVLQEFLGNVKSPLLKGLRNSQEIQTVANIIDESIKEETLAHIREGGFIKEGYDPELDELTKITQNAKKFILELEDMEKKRTGIKSLKIKYNRVFGYFIEVTKSNVHLVPDDYIRKQTQVNAERYITDDLKKKEEIILNSREKQIEIEQRLYFDIVEKIKKNTEILFEASEYLAIVDVISNFSTLALKEEYYKPKLDLGFDIKIEDGRHAVIEKFEEQYIPNDCHLSDEIRMKIITGPNMAGKSSYMRQVALIVILAQIGCYVPAKKTQIGIVDRIFTRIGAFDDLSSGQSTFMVEMNETANIVNNATKKSLIILDEIGRGTSTYDGISLAWAIAEHINEKIGAKTMFATHYHQLNKLSEKYKDVKNFNISVLEEANRIVFLHKIVKGGTDKSYGIEVAKLAGLPSSLIKKAEDVMRKLEIEDVVSDKLIKRNGISTDEATSKVTSKKIDERIDESIKQMTLSRF